MSDEESKSVGSREGETMEETSEGVQPGAGHPTDGAGTPEEGEGASSMKSTPTIGTQDQGGDQTGVSPEAGTHPEEDTKP